MRKVTYLTTPLVVACDERNILTGQEAIAYAEREGVTLNKYSDPKEPALMGVRIEKAKDICWQDPGLIWVRDMVTERRYIMVSRQYASGTWSTSEVKANETRLAQIWASRMEGSDLRCVMPVAEDLAEDDAA